jgi:hypothetical protein
MNVNVTKEIIHKKLLLSKSSRDKYLTRLLVFDRLIHDSESETERLCGPYSEHWEKLIENCKSFKSQYASLEEIYDGPTSIISTVLKDILSDQNTYPDAYVQQVLNLMDERSALYQQIEKELDERIAAVTQMKQLLIDAEKDT